MNRFQRMRFLFSRTDEKVRTRRVWSWRLVFELFVNFKTFKHIRAFDGSQKVVFNHWFLYGRSSKNIDWSWWDIHTWVDVTEVKFDPRVILCKWGTNKIDRTMLVVELWRLHCRVHAEHGATSLAKMRWPLLSNFYASCRRFCDSMLMKA